MTASEIFWDGTFSRQPAASLSVFLVHLDSLGGLLLMLTQAAKVECATAVCSGITLVRMESLA